MKDANYDADEWMPDSVQARSLAYLEHSFVVHNLFQALFEIRDEDRKGLYPSSKGVPADEDWTLPAMPLAFALPDSLPSYQRLSSESFLVTKFKNFSRRMLCTRTVSFGMPARRQI
jgi:hypothetical protein